MLVTRPGVCAMPPIWIRPVKPVSDFDEEAFVERLNVERVLPCAMQGDEVSEVVLLAERVEREVREDFDVRPLR